MRLFTFIFAIYILLLTGIPCCAYDDCAGETTSQTGHSESGKEKGCDNCSPFFSCHSCSCGFIVQDKVTIGSVPFIGFTPVFAYHPLMQEVQYHTDCWQPPRA